MSRFKGRAKRWKKKLQKERWLAIKKESLARGMVEVSENTLVPSSYAQEYETFIPTHLGGKIPYGSNKKLSRKGEGLPKRSIVRELRKQAKRFGITLRQYMNGHW